MLQSCGFCRSFTSKCLWSVKPFDVGFHYMWMLKSRYQIEKNQFESEDVLVLTQKRRLECYERNKRYHCIGSCIDRFITSSFEDVSPFKTDKGTKSLLWSVYESLYDLDPENCVLYWWTRPVVKMAVTRKWMTRRMR